MRLGADDFECLVEFRYYDLAVLVFTRNVGRNIRILKEFHSSDIVHLLNHGLPVYLPKYGCLHRKYKSKVHEIINNNRYEVRLFDDNIVNQVLGYLPHQVQRI
jgi:hypothetical protein